MRRMVVSRSFVMSSVAAASVLLAALPGTAGAATQIGRADGDTDVTCPKGLTMVQSNTGAATPSYAVPPGGGVVVAWSVEAFVLDQRVKLKVLRPTADSTVFRVVGESELRGLPAPGPQQFPTRIPVATGDRIGLTNESDFRGCIIVSTGDSADVLRSAAGDPAVGSDFTATSATQGSTLNIAAQVEPDADADGFGDETQDQCPGQAGPDRGCPPGTLPAPDDGVPPDNDFSFGKVKKNKKKGTAKLTVKVPGPGELELAKTKKVKADEERADFPQGEIPDVYGENLPTRKEKLSIKPRGKAKKKLNRKGKAKVKAKVTYTPDGGEPNTKSKKIKLVKR